ncbi:MAG: hypothetical protein IJC99_03210 [Clostridia bacterium]|nr:hypothetical protein [Clostridia bacterium]
MIKNKFLRFLATLLSSILVIVIVSFIDKAPGSPFTAAMLFLFLMWPLFIFWRGVIGFPGSKPLRMIKNLFMVILIALALIGFIAGIVVYYQDYPEGAPKLAGAMLIATLATYVLGVFSAKDEDHFAFKFAPFVPPAIALVTALGAFLLSMIRPYAFIAMIVFGAGLIVATMYGFKNDYLGFNLTGPSKYTYKPSTSYTPKKTTETPAEAMKSVCSKCEQTRQVSNQAKFFPKITCSFEGGNCVVFTIGGNIMTLRSNINRAVLDDALKITLKNMADEIEVHYQLALDRLRRNGTSTASVSTAKVMRGNIDIT